MPMIAYAVPHTRGTNGRVKCKAAYVNTGDIYQKADLDRFRGKLRDMVVLTHPEAPVRTDNMPGSRRFSGEDLDRMRDGELVLRDQKVVAAQVQEKAPNTVETSGQSLSRELIIEFFEKEGVVAVIAPSNYSVKGALWGPYDKGIVEMGRVYPVQPGKHKPLPHVIMSAEHYNRVFRLIEKGVDVEMGLEINVNFLEEDLQDYNVIAEIPGTDLKDEIVMLGGHLDAKSVGTGAADNAAGVAMIMEALRILKEVDAKPRRTIRVALWGSHEIGRWGSKAYVKENFYDPGTNAALPGYEKLSVYFNSDYYGRICGVYLHGNELVTPLFEQWIEPFRDLGMTHLIPGNSGGSDHMTFIDAGLPGFKWVNDPIEYFSTIHHTNMDLYDRLVEDDLKQAAVINAGWAYLAAMQEDLVPRTPKQKENDLIWHDP
jgi:carboxypeptidase Q